VEVDLYAEMVSHPDLGLSSYQVASHFATQELLNEAKTFMLI
jgi:hypothetical protein